MTQPLHIIVLAGGPDRERDVSLTSGNAVTQALRQAGHHVEPWDVGPDDLSALDRARDWPADVVFPVLHGRWGEGGPLQQHLDQHRLAYVGSRHAAASLCIDKWRTKQMLREHGLPTPDAVRIDDPHDWRLPWDLDASAAVVKAVDEGSSIGLYICPDHAAVQHAVSELTVTYPNVFIERYVRGIELTVGLLSDQAGTLEPLPAIQIVPASTFYDYHAKYADDAGTTYRFEIDLPAGALERVRELALKAGQATGVRHLARVDFVVDDAGEPWILEINTLPGFTSHSLLPMAAERASYDLPTLTDHLARLALAPATA